MNSLVVILSLESTQSPGALNTPGYKQKENVKENNDNK